MRNSSGMNEFEAFVSNDRELGMEKTVLSIDRKLQWGQCKKNEHKLKHW